MKNPTEVSIPYSIPVEMIINIISYLDNKHDIVNCMKLSKEIRDLIFKTPEIMRKFKFSYNYNSPCPIEFFRNRGASIRRLNLNIRPDDEALLRFLLNCTPNLELLVLYKTDDGRTERFMSFAEEYVGIGFADLSKLKYLLMQISDFDYFIKNTKNVKNLQNLTFLKKHHEHSKLLKEFLDQQNYKKELCLAYYAYKWNVDFKHLENVAEYVTEVINDGQITNESISIIFEKFTNLRKFFDLSQRMNIIAERLSSLNSQHKGLKTYVNNLETLNNLNFEIITAKFPNLEILVCNRFQVTEGTNNSLQTLHVNGMSFDNCRNFKLPNLKNFLVDFSSGLTQMLFWNEFSKNIENVEDIEITGYMHEMIDENFAQNLNKFQKLKTFMFTSLRIGSESDVIFVDKTMKVLKVSINLSLKCRIDFNVIWEKFIDYKLIETNFVKSNKLAKIYPSDFGI